MWLHCLSRARNRQISDWYSLGRSLGEGSDGHVVLGRSKEGNQRVAVKKIPLITRGSESVSGRLYRAMKEIQLQHKAAQRCHHVARIIDVFYGSGCCFIILPLADMGSLSQFLDVRNGRMEHDVVRELMVQLSKCVLALHQANIVHRDIKCDNILLSTPMSGRVPSSMLCDFGFASVWRPEMERSMSDFCRLYIGTESYLAPEIMKRGRYGSPVDVFAVGVVCYICLLGRFPFDIGHSSEVLEFMQKHRLIELDQSKVSEDAKSFVYALLNPDPERRLTIAGVLQHKWLRKGRNIIGRRRRLGEVSVEVVLRRVVYVILAVGRIRHFWRQGVERGTGRKVRKETGFDRAPWSEAWSAGQLKLSSGQLTMNGFSRDAVQR